MTFIDANPISDTTKDRFMSLYHLPDIVTTPTSLNARMNALGATGQKHKGHTRSSISTKSYGHRTHESLSLANATTDNASASGTDAAPKSKKERAFFHATVLELVKLVQAGLAIFGMYGPTPLVGDDSKRAVLVLDGLLCDSAVEGIQRWMTEIGEPSVGVEVPHPS